MKRKLSAVLLAAPVVLLSLTACDPGNPWASRPAKVSSSAAASPSSSTTPATDTTTPSTTSTKPAPASTTTSSSRSSSKAPATRSSSSAAATPSAAPSRTCTDPVFTTSDPNGGWSDGGYYVHNNMWNQDEAGPETLSACAYNNWYVDSTQSDTTSVKTYPNVHKDINNLNGAPFDSYSTITSTFAGRGPGTGIYNVAYDVWLNGVGQGEGVTELMVWTENHNQVPSGSKTATYTAGGVTYDVWRNNSGYLAFVAQNTVYAGSIDLKAMIAWAIGKGYIPENPTVNQIGYGIEFCSTDNAPARFTLTDFSVTMN